MAGLIPQSFIDDLIDRVDIVEVVDHRVKLKKTGKNYSACCPFHDEKTPSFTVSPDKQFYYCFGCGASGNALGFVMDYERLGFPETVEVLARLAGLEVPREARDKATSKREQQKKSIYSLLEKADQFFRQQLRQHPSRNIPVSYLKGRGLSGEIARDFGIGYAPPGWDNLLQTLGQNAEDKRLLIDGGMLINREEDNKLYDRFRQRIMFPIRDTRGRVIGFGGRVLGDDKPKYLNSPETPVFHKGRELYGLYEARQAYRQLPRLLVVEGYMDVVALAQFDIRYGVATLGTACGEEHLNRAFRYTTEVVFCFDGDNAGRNAARRALENTLPAMQDGRQVKFLFLPEGEDPDTLVRQLGAEKFTAMIDTAVPLEDFLFDVAAEGLDIQSMEGRARMSKLAAPLLDRLPKGVYRELMFDNLANRTGLSKDTLIDLIQELPTTEAQHQTPGNTRSDGLADNHSDSNYHADELPRDYGEPGYNGQSYNGQDYDEPDHGKPYYDEPDYYYPDPSSPPPQRDKRLPATQGQGRYKPPPKRKIIALTLSQPALAAEVENPERWEEHPDPDLQLFAKLVKILKQRPHYKLQHLIGFWRAAYGEKETQHLADIAGIDLIQASKSLPAARKGSETQAGYDLVAAFKDTLSSLHRQAQSDKSASSLEKLKNSNFTELSKEEKQQLVREALAGKSASDN